MVHSLKLKLSVLRSMNIITNKQIMQVFNVSKQSIYNWKANKYNTGTYKYGGSKYTPEIRSRSDHGAKHLNVHKKVCYFKN